MKTLTKLVASGAVALSLSLPAGARDMQDDEFSPDRNWYSSIYDVVAAFWFGDIFAYANIPVWRDRTNVTHPLDLPLDATTSYYMQWFVGNGWHPSNRGGTFVGPPERGWFTY